MSDATITTQGQDRDAGFGDYFALLKPRVMSLVVFTALAGLVAAPGALHPVEALAAILFIALGAGAAGALNMWWDADIDALMQRTRSRPIPAGKVRAGEARALGVGLAGLAVVMLALATNVIAAALLAFTIFFYVVVYSMWLKRWTPQNIVIGGAAGAFPPIIGWAAVTGGVALEALAMFAIIFFWTPPHFWALALFMKSDYHDARVPMLTVTHGRRVTRNHILGYSVVLAAVGVAAGFTALGGPAYWVAAIVLNALVLKGAVAIWRSDEKSAEAARYAKEKRLFRLSLWYLFAIFSAIMIDTGLAAWGII